MTVSLGAHISDSSRAKLKLYQEVYKFRNVSDALEDVLTKMPTPEPVEEPVEDVVDPNQTTLSEHE